MALCMWRDDWPPHPKDVRHGILEYNDFIDLKKPFMCRHPPEGPEELQCYTMVNITYSECLHYSTELKDVRPETIKIKASNLSKESFQLCILDLHCDLHFRKYDT